MDSSIIFFYVEPTIVKRCINLSILFVILCFTVRTPAEGTQSKGQSSQEEGSDSLLTGARTRGESIHQLQRLHHQIRAPRLGGKVCVCSECVSSVVCVCVCGVWVTLYREGACF